MDPQPQTRIASILPGATPERVTITLLPGSPPLICKSDLLYTRRGDIGLCIEKTGEGNAAQYVIIRSATATQDLEWGLRVHLETGWPLGRSSTSREGAETPADAAHHAALAETDQTRIG